MIDLIKDLNSLPESITTASVATTAVPLGAPLRRSWVKTKKRKRLRDKEKS